MLTPSTQLQNSSFVIVERTRTSVKSPKMKSALTKHAKLLFFIVKYANLWHSCCQCRHGGLNALFTSSDIPMIQTFLFLTDIFTLQTTWNCFLLHHHWAEQQNASSSGNKNHKSLLDEPLFHKPAGFILPFWSLSFEKVSACGLLSVVTVPLHPQATLCSSGPSCSNDG